MKGVTGTNLLQLLERRLDVVVLRMGFARTIMQSRQFVNHGHFMVNDRKVNIPSYLVRPGDVVTVRERSHSMTAIQEAMEARQDASQYSWLEIDTKAMRGTYVEVPTREQIPVDIDERLIVEFYSK